MIDNRCNLLSNNPLQISRVKVLIIYLQQTQKNSFIIYFPSPVAHSHFALCAGGVSI